MRSLANSISNSIGRVALGEDGFLENFGFGTVTLPPYCAVWQHFWCRQGPYGTSMPGMLHALAAHTALIRRRAMKLRSGGLFL